VSPCGTRIDLVLLCQSQHRPNKPQASVN
jgi:hypothetical protein